MAPEVAAVERTGGYDYLVGLVTLECLSLRDMADCHVTDWKRSLKLLLLFLCMTDCLPVQVP